jgi:S-methylmethionine-dependent homocysteine/selenocysteine methylase
MQPLKSGDDKHNFFLKLSEINDNDHAEVKYVKNKIKKLVDQELDLMGFKDQLSREEMDEILQDSLKEVKTKSNFYFSVDENKL